MAGPFFGEFMIRKILRTFIALILVSGAGCGSNTLKVKVLKGAEGKAVHAFRAEIADDPGERSQGLMFRKTLGPNEGMLFIYTSMREGPFWMKNTLIPLDMLFIGQDKKIHTIIANAEPQTLIPRKPSEPYLYVLEIPGGRAQQLAIQAGDRVEW